ncbi:hypothetical protein AO1008_00207 [Aspergillus oryzae 100-8]|uniref:Xylanolytic transcriptional activator regulatory domain-containing protein n=1 Tax=Aspergillus oryzae (strain 3.042) TaxID=1160506 RepID=I8TW73_ASPO3|nr:hypothetical protein Ao3042_04898 [Aspergillus oryzae 3.042]KDE84922.1 hypothetical protein AO1008_00207 [Aspergillus oryzae 100-8]|eukprot:EIT78670.1 hypothetical protein Ao3042_04898 [Aspergillus oryzae 3.042]
MSYRALTQRLENMERLISESMHLPTSQMRREYLHNVAGQFTRQTTGLSLGPTQSPLTINLCSHEDRSMSLDMKDRNGERLCIGSCSILSPEGIRWINALVGDESFSSLLSGLKIPRKAPLGNFEGRVNHPLPSNDMIKTCFKDFATTFNNALHLFEDDYLDGILQRHLDGQSFLDATSYAAFNIVLAQSLRKFDNMRPDAAEKCFENAFSILPVMMMQSPNKASIATMLFMTMYLVYTSRSHPSATVLGAAIQSILMAGYHHPLPPQDSSTALHEKILLYHAFILDQDLAMYHSKPPSLTSDLISCLPEEDPEDGRNTLRFDDGSTINWLREQVILANIQNKVYDKLRSPRASAQSPEQLYVAVMELDEELQSWRQNIPDMARPQTPLTGLDDMRLMPLTVLHFCYFQLLISIHSVVFSKAVPLWNHYEESDLVISSVALCVSAARASISLLNYHDQGHPFTIYLVYHIAWNVDILLISILENKTAPQAREDLDLLGTVIRFFEKHDPNCESAVPYHITRLYYQVALRAVNNATAASQNAPQESPAGPLATAKNNEDSSSFPYSNHGDSMDTGTATPVSGLNGSPNPLLYSWGMQLSFLPELWQDPHLAMLDDGLAEHSPDV